MPPFNAIDLNHAALPDEWRVELRDELLEGLKSWLSEDNVKILYH